MPDSSTTRILHLLKTRGPQTAATIAKHLQISSVATRRHLAVLSGRELVNYQEQTGKVGRPQRRWKLSDSGHAQFPDAHDFLTLELITSVRSVFGDDGLERLIATRESETLQCYQAVISQESNLAARISALARLRSEEGYMAEVTRKRDGSFVLAENNCPICAAAKECQGFCRSELAIFQAALGPDVSIKREEHIIAGARRCAYRIAEKDGLTA